jgi:hypothetical protein
MKSGDNRDSLRVEKGVSFSFGFPFPFFLSLLVHFLKLFEGKSADVVYGPAAGQQKGQQYY